MENIEILSALNRRRKDDNMHPWFTILLKYGVGGGLAIYFAWFLTNQVSGTLTSVKENLALHTTDAQYNLKTNEKIYYLLRTICVNSAQTNEDRSNCLQ